MEPAHQYPTPSEIRRVEFRSYDHDRMRSDGEAWVGEDGRVYGSNEYVDRLLDDQIGLVFGADGPTRRATREDGALMLWGYMAESSRATYWDVRPLEPTWEGEVVTWFPASLDALVERAWELYADACVVAPSKVVTPSMPILFFGDLLAYLRSPLRVITVGLNPSLAEFPAEDPWIRFPGASRLTPPLTADERKRYLYSLCDYFRTEPYVKWFKRGFEPLLNGLDATYFDEPTSVSLHTDIASPVATNPTWSNLRESQKLLQEEGQKLWRALAEALEPDLILVSTARHHLSAITATPLGEWRELARVERQNPFIVSGTSIELAGRPVLVAFGRCTDLPFGSVSVKDRVRLGNEIGKGVSAFPERPADTW
jgi:hypothetical protein